MWPKGCLDALATGHRACSPCLWAVAILWASRHLTLLGRSRRCPKRCAVVHCNNSIRGRIDTIDFALAHSGSAGNRAEPPSARIIPVQRQNIDSTRRPRQSEGIVTPQCSSRRWLRTGPRGACCRGWRTSVAAASLQSHHLVTFPPASAAATLLPSVRL